MITLVAASALLAEESGVSTWLSLRESLEVSSVRVAELEAENEVLRSEIAMLEAEPAAVDRAIREELDLALPGEVVVYFTGSGSALTAARP